MHYIITDSGILQEQIAIMLLLVEYAEMLYIANSGVAAQHNPQREGDFYIKIKARV